MGTRSSFFTLADHAAAREFGKRHYGVFVGLRLVRAVWPVFAALAVVGGVVLVLLWSPDLPDVSIRIPEVPLWAWAGIGAIALVSGLALLRKFSLGFRMFLFRIGL